MKSPHIAVALVILAGITLSGCSFADLFSKLATSNLEQGAQEEYAQGKIIEAKQATIEQKKQQFSQWTELKNVNESTGYVAVAYRNNQANSTQIDIEAMLPNPDRQVYQVWLRGENVQDRINIGVMKFNQTDDYSLSYTSQKNLDTYKMILISREASPDDKPEKIIMTGAFEGVSASTAATLQK